MHFGIRGKLFASFGTTIALLASVGFIGWQNTNELGQRAEDIYENQLTGALALANSESALWELRYGFPQFLVQPEKRSDILAAQPKLYKVIENNLQTFAQLDLTPQEQEAFKNLESVYKRYIAARPRWFELIQAGKFQEAAEHRAATTTPYGKETVDSFKALIDLQREVAAQNYSNILAQEKQMQILLSISLLVGLGLAGVLAFVISRDIVKSLLQAAGQITSSSTEIATTVEQQERTITQQASSVIQTTTTMDELGASSYQSAQQAEASAAGAQQALSLAEDGTQAVQETLEGMSTLKEKVGAIAGQILRLSEQTQQIGGISDLVGDLANQTNMLALNAAVEAARAGEHGKGFGVVAGEIRKLADQSKKSAEKINALVGDIQSAINTTVMATDEGTKNVDFSMKLTQSTAKTFTGVADAVNNVFLNSQQISLSAKQQAVAVQQVVAAMDEINLGAKESASGITLVKTSTEQLKDAAHNLKALV